LIQTLEELRIKVPTSMGFKPMIFANRTAVIATMHGKEKVIAPILRQEFGISAIVSPNLNTDQFGTFTRDLNRTGTQIEAARFKAEAALLLADQSLAISSEGSFFPHPLLGIPCDREIVMLLDRANDLEIVGEEMSVTTNFDCKLVKNWQEIEKFAQKVGFPDHGLVAIAPNGIITKGITSVTELSEIVERTFAMFPSEVLRLETDMRAFYNPTRMINIEKATLNLVNKMHSLCPQCHTPGFAITEYKSGLRCSLCGSPTELTRAAVYRCQKCDFRQEVAFPNGAEAADPQYCPYCNP
jgi:hypothetical protein